MNKFTLPNYKGGSIVNLMSSIAQSFGNKTKYNSLKILPPNELKKSKNIVLIVIDGMGFEYLKENGKDTIFENYLKGSMTSVFLPTTASAITSFLTGVAPQQHALTAWFMNLKEIGVVSAILPFSARVGGEPFSNYDVSMDSILNAKSFATKIKTKCFVINSKPIIDSDFTNYTSSGAEKLSYININSFFSKIKKSIKSSNRRKYIYAYWSKFDSLSHENGVNSKRTLRHFKKLNREFKKFVKSIEGTDTTLIITADHGFVDVPLNRNIKLENYPKLKECLTLPLCGEGRISYCYVHPAKAKDFERQVKTKLKKYCDLFKSQELIKKNYFGLFKPHPKLFDRVGDYILICKENYIIKDSIVRRNKNKKKEFLGYHGGISKNEMLVPLIVIKL